MTALPPFNPDAVCPKCGKTEPRRQWRAAEGGKPERIERWCPLDDAGCGFAWDEATLDSGASPWPPIVPAWDGDAATLAEWPGKEAFGDVLKRLRVAAGLSQSAFAERIRCSQTAVSMGETGERTVSIEQAFQRAEASGFDLVLTFTPKAGTPGDESTP